MDTQALEMGIGGLGSQGACSRKLALRLEGSLEARGCTRVRCEALVRHQVPRPLRSTASAQA
eukprot:12291092-Alexandrium_andersonii.AAC.1